MRKTKRWTPEDLVIFRENYSKPGGVEFLMKTLGRKRTALWAMATKLKLKHYVYILRGGKGKYRKPDLSVENLKQNTRLDEKTGCWVWRGPHQNNGYGCLMINRKTQSAHRLMFAAANPSANMDEVQVNHHCDNPPCINPAHMYAGTQSENLLDAVRRGRWRGGRKAANV